MQERQKDPTQLKVQMNIQVPWQFREDLIVIAEERHMSLNALVRAAISTALAEDLTNQNKRLTSEAGATK